MEIQVDYSKTQMEYAVEFIATHNPHFLGKQAEIRRTITLFIEEMVRNTSMEMNGTMGFMLISTRIFEGIDSDINSIHLEIWVDPSVGHDKFEDEWHEATIQVEV